MIGGDSIIFPSSTLQLINSKTQKRVFSIQELSDLDFEVKKYFSKLILPKLDGLCMYKYRVVYMYVPLYLSYMYCTLYAVPNQIKKPSNSEMQR